MRDSSPLIPHHGRLWLLFGLAVSGAFFILGFFGREGYRQAPPIPEGGPHRTATW
jgi:nitric oxide reductase large subunit